MHSLNKNLESTHCGSQRGASSPRPGPWPRSTPQSPDPPWGSWGHQHLPEVSGESHTREGEERVSVDVVLRRSGEAQVRQAEGVHQVGLVDAGAQLGGAAQPAGHAVIPMKITIVLHKGFSAKESGQHDLAGGGRGVEADGARHSAHALSKEGHGLLCNEVV
jgi:hypothetical protein